MIRDAMSRRAVEVRAAWDLQVGCRQSWAQAAQAPIRRVRSSGAHCNVFLWLSRVESVCHEAKVRLEKESEIVFCLIWGKRDPPLRSARARCGSPLHSLGAEHSELKCRQREWHTYRVERTFIGGLVFGEISPGEATLNEPLLPLAGRRSPSPLRGPPLRPQLATYLEAL